MADIIPSILGAVALCVFVQIARQVLDPNLVRRVEEVAPYLVGLVQQELGFLFNYQTNVEDLIKSIEKLGFLKGRVERSIEIARNNAFDIQPDVINWQNSLNEIEKKVGKFFDDEEKEKKKCLYGWCPNLKSHYLLSKRAKRTAVEIGLQIQAGENFDKSDGVSYFAPSQGIGSTPIKGYEAFESRISTLNEVMEALKDPNINMIGICGMAGVGKTMLAEEIARKAKENKSVNEVVKAVVSQTPNIRTIQEEIADKLSFRFEDKESDSERKNRLCKRLKNEKNILVILDDIWEKLDLEAIGIPSGDDHKGCTTVFTSRNQDTLPDKMGAQKNFVVKVLSDEEAWNLFKKIAGIADSASRGSNDRGDFIEAREIAKECEGLPLAIRAVASALKNRSFPVWKDALEQLKSSTPTNIVGIDSKVYSSLKLSYDFLVNDDARSLFLLCCLLPEDHNISIRDILKYGKGLGLFHGTLEKARDRAHALVALLKGSSLLLDGSTTESVRVHDVIRDVGIFIATEEKNMLIVRNKDQLEKWLSEEKLIHCRAMSLPYGNIHELPTGLECPKLQSLLLLSKYRFLAIPDTFFEGMKQLKILNLTNMCFSSLPSSLHLLSSLQTLCLDYCMFRYIPIHNLAMIGELKKLEVLSFAGSNIEELPREIGQLTSLRLLDLEECSKLKVIPSNVIASLSKLEDLYMGMSFVRWEVDGNASLSELKHLSHLVTLDIHIRDANIMPQDLHFENLMRYKISIGGDVSQYWYGDYEASRTLKLNFNTGFQQFELNMLPGRTEDLYLDGLNGIKSVVYGLNKEGFSYLKRLVVKRSREIEYIINTTMEGVPGRAFPKLESLSLCNLINLKEICHGQLPLESFFKLRTMEVKWCDNLKNLFSSSMARRLLQLQELEVNGCETMNEIVAEGREESEGNIEAMDKIMFRELRYLKLENLPDLVSFWSKGKTRPSLNHSSPTADAGPEEIISEDKHDILIPLFNEKVAFPNLEYLGLSGMSSTKEIWQGQFGARSFCKLTALRVYQCGSLTHILSPVIAKSLVQIKRIIVIDCKMMKEIILSEEGEVTDEITFGQLKYLELGSLPNLTSCCPKNNTFSFPSLKEVRVRDCPKLKTFSEGNLNTPQLEKVHIPPYPIDLEQEDDWLWKGELNTTIQHLFIQTELIQRMSSTPQLHEKKWVDNNSGYICLMLYAKSNSVCWGTSPEYWAWICLKERSDETILVARLIKVCWLDVRGKVNISDLSPGTVYEIVYVVMLTHKSYGWEDDPITLELSLPNKEAQKHQVSLLEKPKRQWIELNVGNFSTDDGAAGEVCFSLTEHGGHWKSGLIIKGAIIRPKI